MELKLGKADNDKEWRILLIAPLMELKFNTTGTGNAITSTFNRTAYGIEITLRH